MCTQQMLGTGEHQKYFCGDTERPIKSRFVMYLMGGRKAQINRESVCVYLCVPACVLNYGSPLRCWHTDEGVQMIDDLGVIPT